MNVKELINKIKSKYDSWDTETKEIFDVLWGRMEAAETDLEVFELRLKKEWPTKGSNLYTEQEVFDIKVEYFDRGSDAGRYSII
jgi:hypothetical protein